MNTCKSCKLHLQRKTQVNGEGKWFQPRLFIVGDYPGREEDDTGRPYAGGAGRVLNSILSNAGVPRSDCYVTYTVGCRPPNNREPDLEELYQCQGRLRGEVDKVKPHIIVALGDLAGTFLTGKPVQTWRGAVVPGIGPAADYNVLLTYSPTFVMRMRTMYPVVVWDMVKALNYTGDLQLKENYITNPDRETLQKTFQDWKARNLKVAVDIETTGNEDDESKAALNPWSPSFEIIGISFTPTAGEALHLNGRAFLLNWDLMDEFLSQHPYLIYQNNTFDRCAIMAKRGYLTGICWDTLNGIHLINPALPKKLDFLRSLYTNIPPYKDIYKTNGKYRPGMLGEEALARLNHLDTDVTWRVAEAQRKFVTDLAMQDLLEEDDIAIEMRVRGLLVDKLAIARHYATILPQIDQLQSKFAKDYQCIISSPAQLKKVLYQDFKFPPHDQEGKSCLAAGASTNEKAIQAIAGKLGLVYMNDEDGERFEGEHPDKQVLVDILKYRGFSKTASTYCEGVFKALDADGVLHPQWTTAVTDTGRWSCRGTPIQGFPKHMRDAIVARPGKVYFGADYKGMQILAAAVLAGDFDLAERMLDPNYSLHNEVLEAIKPHYPSIKKVQAKTVVFGTFFGRTPRSIAQAFHVPQATAELWQGIFYSQRPKLRTLFEETLIQAWQKQGYAVGITGRKKYCEAVTEAKNHPIQNFESVVVKRALKKLKLQGWTPVMMIHDQIVCEEDDLGPEGNDKKYSEFQHILETIAPEYFKRFPVEGGWGYTWAEV